jgi:Arc/MetJ family transcription regulator
LRITVSLIVESDWSYTGIMKTTVDIPDEELAEAMKFTKAKTKREAIVTAIAEFNRRRRMAELVKYSRSSRSLITASQLQKLRRRE